MKNATMFSLAAIVSCCLAAAAPLPVHAQEKPSPAPKASGFVDPEGIPQRPPAQDIEPVYRGPAVDTLATIRKRGVLRVGVSAVEPMVMHDDKGALVGFSVDLSRKLAEDIGVPVEFVETSWSQVIPDLLERRFDVIVTGLWVTPVRALVINFSNPTSVEGVYLIANRQMAGAFKTRDEFNRPEVKIAVYAGTVQERVARKMFPRATLVPVTGNEIELDAALGGKAHAALVTTFAPRVLMGQAADKLFLPFAEPLQSAESALGLRKGDPDFLNYLNSWLSFQRNVGWLDERVRYWAEPQDWMK